MQDERSGFNGNVPRRSALTTIAAAAVASSLCGQQKRQQQNPQHKHEGMVNISPPPVYKVRFFTEAEFVTLAALVDLIIPRTDTPGASDAGVHRIIDAGVKPPERQAWRDGLAWLETEARSSGGKPFVEMPQASQFALLERASRSGHVFFRLLKDAVVDAFYSTREGLVTELGWNANTFLPAFKGCTHPEHQA